jgi:hypothetical protein
VTAPIETATMATAIKRHNEKSIAHKQRKGRRAAHLKPDAS